MDQSLRMLLLTLYVICDELLRIVFTFFRNTTSGVAYPIKDWIRLHLPLPLMKKNKSDRSLLMGVPFLHFNVLHHEKVHILWMKFQSLP